MNIKCTQCGHIHQIPDEKIANKRVFFFCQNCGHKISVDTAASTNREVQVPPVETFDWRSLFSSIPSFFSLQAFVVAMSYYLLIMLVGAIAAVAAFKHSQFFLENRLFAIALIFAALYLLVFTANLTRYYISKISFYRFSHPDAPVDFNHVHFDLQDDILVIFLYSLLSTGVPMLLLFPLYFAGSWGVFIGGLLFPVFLFFAAVSIILVFSGNYVTAHIASASLFTRDHFIQMFRFIKREFIFFPFFSLLIWIMRILFAKISLLFGILTSLAAAAGMFLLLSFEGKNAFSLFFHDLFSGSVISSSSLSSTGILLCIVFSSTLGLAILALNSLFSQSLYARAVYIMKRSPGAAFETTPMIIIIAVFLVISILSILSLKLCGLLRVPFIAQLLS